MPTTPKVKLVYPVDSGRDWFELYVELMNDLDGKIFASREDRNIIKAGGGSFSFNAGTGLLSWSANIDLFSPTTGYIWRIAAGSVTLNDGQCMYITLARAPQSTSVYTPQIGNTVPNEPNGDNNLLIGWRSGSVVYFRDGSSTLDTRGSLLTYSPVDWAKSNNGAWAMTDNTFGVVFYVGVAGITLAGVRGYFNNSGGANKDIKVQLTKHGSGILATQTVTNIVSDSIFTAMFSSPVALVPSGAHPYCITGRCTDGSAAAYIAGGWPWAYLPTFNSIAFLWRVDGTMYMPATGSVVWKAGDSDPLVGGAEDIFATRPVPLEPIFA